MPKGFNSGNLCEKSMATDIKTPSISYDGSRYSPNDIIGFNNDA
jgi:hypothetical protein